ncbi:hypothetical protein PybrP1_002791, partial [[Pythium] brassicae (nom. inval.)]
KQPAMTTSERVAAFLAHANIVDALREDVETPASGNEIHVVALLSDVASLSDQYIPTLQFLMRPDNLKQLVQCILREPVAEIGDRRGSLCERHAPGGGDFPSYEEYALMYRAHWVLCASGFSSQLIAALVGLHQDHRRDICREITACNSRDTMVLEALARFLSVFMDQYSPEALVDFFGDEHLAALLETLLVLNFYEPIRDVLLRILNDTPVSVATLQGATTQLLRQLSPTVGGSGVLPLESERDAALQSRIAQDEPHQAFSRMLFTCDLLTDLIHERRSGSVGFFYVNEIASSPKLASWLIDAALHDLRMLPTAFANESYTVKVLNSLLQQSQCGCVAKAAFLAPATPRADGADSTEDDERYTQGSPHDDLPEIWKLFIARLPEFLKILELAKQPRRHFKTTHVQLIYLMLPILNVSCTAVDRQLGRARTLECALDLILLFPASNILHCAISRLFIVALEDSPFMFGKELPAFRAANDPLRLHLLLRGCLDTVLRAFGSDAVTRCSPPPAFLDVAISFDQALTSAQAHSPQLFSSALTEAWYDFRRQVLLPTQAIWEEQYEPKHEGKKSPKRYSVADLFDPASEISLPVQAVPTQQEEAERIDMLQRAIAAATIGSDLPLALPPLEAAPEFSSPLNDRLQPVSRAAEDVPTPLAALYNDEEKDLMRAVASTAPPSPGPPPSSSLSLAAS